MTLRYGSVCSGIEAASAAWHPLGWTPEFFAEIERFPSEVLAHHYGSNLPSEPWSGNAPPNLGDMTRFQEWPDAVLDVLVGGTPCQSFSVAGLRKGLADPRGNLALTYLAIADRYRPRWVVWENVPGVLSSNGGRDFGAFLGGLAELGYGWAYRVLDAQYFGVPQQRERVFVVGHADWRRASSVLFERESFEGRAQSRQAPVVSVCITRRGPGSLDDRETYIVEDAAVRHMTPLEIERCFGFPDGYTAIPRNGKPAADGPRYKALGNSMAVNVMRWIGRRIEAVERLEAELEHRRVA